MYFVEPVWNRHDVIQNGVCLKYSSLGMVTGLIGSFLDLPATNEELELLARTMKCNNQLLKRRTKSTFRQLTLYLGWTSGVLES